MSSTSIRGRYKFRRLASTYLTLNWLRVSEESQRFRMRAKQCRELAAVARDDYSRQTLTQLAGELDAEADKIEADEDPEMPLGPVPI